jgi:hypothetical protein
VPYAEGCVMFNNNNDSAMKRISGTNNQTNPMTKAFLRFIEEETKLEYKVYYHTLIPTEKGLKCLPELVV